ncbi:DUF998 domain-containing protein [Pseudovibrio brasiliensis]|uniref:DUF998 domain-containing protein n=1 Tax=Pseudovibrio brasiliensis TaxID=1898042 RepID=A0ABX8ALV0_9HYPH|nr:DUF998 domain-containing protein [Pseudovibrio brasiliensis]QUS55573.1 DUF998 domain-containing protein [Pseudovibrio brasiliensis]
MKKTDIALLFVVLSYLWLVATVVIGAQFYPGYSHISHFMSVLGATGAPHGSAVNFWGFLAVELLLLSSFIICFTDLMQSRAERVALVVFAGYPLFIGLAAFFPCDFECRMDDPSQSQLIHSAAGLFAYFWAVVGLCLLARAQKGQSYWFVPGLILFALFLSLTLETALSGLLQRVLETGAYLWFVLILLQKRQRVGGALASR